MGMTMTQKILAAHAGLKEVKASATTQPTSPRSRECFTAAATRAPTSGYAESTDGELCANCHTSKD